MKFQIMASNYRSIPPVGQWDGMSCWAACLAWWLKAVGGERPKWSQKDLIVNFYGFTDDSGGIQVDQLIAALNNNPNLRSKLEPSRVQSIAKGPSLWETRR